MGSDHGLGFRKNQNAVHCGCYYPLLYVKTRPFRTLALSCIEGGRQGAIHTTLLQPVPGATLHEQRILHEVEGETQFQTGTREGNDNTRMDTLAAVGELVPKKNDLTSILLVFDVIVTILLKVYRLDAALIRLGHTRNQAVING